MTKITGPKLQEIQERIDRVQTGADELNQLLTDTKLMLDIIQEIRHDAHLTEDSDSFTLGVAKRLGTNCSPDKGIDEV